MEAFSIIVTRVLLSILLLVLLRLPFTFIVRFSTFFLVSYRIMYRKVDRLSNKLTYTSTQIPLSVPFDYQIRRCCLVSRFISPRPYSLPFIRNHPAPPTTTEQIFWFLGRDSITGASFGTMWEWYFRTSLDHWSTFLGMIFALNYPATAQWMKKVESMPAGRQWTIKGSVAIVLFAATAWWAANILPVS